MPVKGTSERMYLVKQDDLHRPARWMSAGAVSFDAAVEAAPILKLCGE